MLTNLNAKKIKRHWFSSHKLKTILPNQTLKGSLIQNSIKHRQFHPSLHISRLWDPVQSLEHSKC